MKRYFYFFSLSLFLTIQINAGTFLNEFKNDLEVLQTVLQDIPKAKAWTLFLQYKIERFKKTLLSRLAKRIFIPWQILIWASYLPFLCSNWIFKSWSQGLHAMKERAHLKRGIREESTWLDKCLLSVEQLYLMFLSKVVVWLLIGLKNIIEPIVDDQKAV